ncbi:hypothetical protein [Candidatus Thalassolituus haligoni]|uniref:hypothetical protein n=1 Tax=Candidatus Thalassolituus haligoni TaxID=3100113 RepID=UPI003512531F
MISIKSWLVVWTLALVMALTSLSVQARINSVTEARLQSLNGLSNLLMFYNPSFENRDPGLQQQYWEAFEDVRAWAAKQSYANELSQPIDNLIKSIKRLEAEPEEYAHMRPVWINKVVQNHARLEQLLQPHDKANTPETRMALYLSMQNLAYQTGTFSSINMLLMDGRPDIMELLDTEIEKELTIIRQTAQSKDLVTKLETRYQFIRPRLVGHQEKWVPNLVSYYYHSMVELLGQIQSEPIVSG